MAPRERLNETAAGGAVTHPGPQPPIIAILPSTSPITGGVRADLRIVEQLARRGWQIEVVGLSDRPDRAPRYRWRDQLMYNLRLIRRFRAAPKGCILLEDQALSSAVGIFNLYARRWRKARVVLVTHHLVFELFRSRPRRLLHLFIEGTVARRGDLVIAQSQSTMQALLRIGVPEATIRVIPFGSGLGSPAAYLERSGRAGENFRLLTVGQVVPRKGLEYLIAAAASLMDLQWTLDIVGELEPAYHHSLQQQARSLSVAERITFRGRLADAEVENLLYAADIFVQPSLWEGFGLAVLEAMERGLPVVASSAGALPELVQDEQTGLLVPPADAPRLAAALRRLMCDPELRERLGRAAASAVRSQASWEETGRLLDEALSAL